MASEERSKLLQRAKAGIMAVGSQGEIALSLGISRNWLSGFLNRRNKLASDTLGKLCAACNFDKDLREALFSEFYPELGEPSAELLKSHQGASEVWFIARNFPWVDDGTGELLRIFVDNIVKGVHYTLCSNYTPLLVWGLRQIEAALENVAVHPEVTFVEGPRFTNLGAWCVRDPHCDHREVVELSVRDLEMLVDSRRRVRKIQGALAKEITSIFAPLAGRDGDGFQFFGRVPEKRQ